MNKTFCRFEVKCNSSYKATQHAKYVLGLGQYAHKQSEIQHSSSGNLPDWAGGDVMAFWKGCDEGEFNSKGELTKYREHVINLPRELTEQERIDLVEAWIEEELGDRHAYSYAIHTPLSNTDGLVQPHVHLMFSERIHDGIERSQEQYFKQYRPKNPQNGGCKKIAEKGNRTKLLQERKNRFEGVCNAFLAPYGVKVDLSSREARGMPKNAQKHASRAEYHAQLEARQAQQAVEQALCDYNVYEKDLQEQAEKDEQERIENDPENKLAKYMSQHPLKGVISTLSQFIDQDSRKRMSDGDFRRQISVELSLALMGLDEVEYRQKLGLAPYRDKEHEEHIEECRSYAELRSWAYWYYDYDDGERYPEFRNHSFGETNDVARQALGVLTQYANRHFAEFAKQEPNNEYVIRAKKREQEAKGRGVAKDNSPSFGM